MGPGGLLASCTPTSDLVQLSAGPWGSVGPFRSPTWASPPLLGEGQALTLCLSTCPLALISVQTQSLTYYLSDHSVGGGESSKSSCLKLGHCLQQQVRGRQATEVTPPSCEAQRVRGLNWTAQSRPFRAPAFVCWG